MRPKRPKKPTVQFQSVPAPMGGLNTVSPAGAMPMTDCAQAFNLIPAERGLRSRLGEREHCTGLAGLTDNLVREVLPFNGSTVDANRLFATTSTGIWDVSASSEAPAQVFAFASDTDLAGYGVCHAVVTAAGHYLLYCDEENGLHIYSETTDTWAAAVAGVGPGEFDGADPADFVFVTTFKKRVMFVERGTARIYYLDAGAIAGEVTPFEVGTQFKAGGSLVGAWNWTMDGGAGLDDALVMVSTGGDVAIYQGTDIADANNFGLKGVWFVGGLPAGRRIATDFGGDMLLLTALGPLPLSRLLSGNPIAEQQYATAKIQNLINLLMLSRSALRGWTLRLHPQDNTLLLMVPTTDGAATEQLAMPLARPGAWYPYRDLPIYSSEVWAGKLYFGTTDGRVCVNEGYVDGVKIAAADAGAFTPVQWGVSTAPTNMGRPTQKRIQMIRPTLLSDSGRPDFRVEARYRYDAHEMSPVSGTNGSADDAWDAATWDSDVWAGEYRAAQQTFGATGMGVEVAIAIRGTAQTRTILVGFDVAFDEGGFL